MRITRSVITALLIGLLGLGVATTGSVTAAGASSLPKRIITEEPPSEHQVSYNAFKLKGSVAEPQADGTVLPYTGKVHLQKKACKGCHWKVVKKLKTNDAGVFKAKIFTPSKGRWKWRVKVGSSAGFATTKGKTWTLFFQ